jgi:peptide deformylase
VTEFDQHLADLITTMGDVMYELGGVGLAANQIGISKRLFVYDSSTERNDLRVMVNPVLVTVEDEEDEEEGCLSLPGGWWPVMRAQRVQFRGMDATGNPIEGVVEEFEARILQHETDHLDGKTLYSRITKQERLLALDLLSNG